MTSKSMTSKKITKKRKRLVRMAEQPEIFFRMDKPTIPMKFPIHLGVPTTGLVRFEWFAAMQAMIVPISYATRMSGRNITFTSPIGMHVAEARNHIVDDFLKNDSEWLLFIDHDVLPNSFTHGFMLEHLQNRRFPIFSGLYYTKSSPSYPLVFRGRGIGPYTNWKMGDQVMVDGLPMGMTMIHRSILEYMSKHSPSVQISTGVVVKEIFKSPRIRYEDPETLKQGSLIGTEDLHFCERVMSEGVFAKTGWKSLAKKKYPFMIDTRIICKHIDMNGTQWP